MSTPQPSQPLVSSSLAPEELDALLRRIDENLELRSVLRSNTTATNPTVAPPALPDLTPRFGQLELLRRLGELLYVHTGSLLPDLGRRFLNLPIKIFARKQIFYNRELNSMLTALLEHLAALNEHAVYTATQASRNTEVLTHLQTEKQELVQSQVAALQARIDELQEAQQQLASELSRIDAERQSQAKAIEQLTNSLTSHERWLQQLTTDAEGSREWLAQIAKIQQGHSEWTELLQRKLTMLAVDMRERLSGSAIGLDTIPEPRIVDPERYAQLLAEMQGKVRVNLGCGEKPLPGYINIDVREVPEVVDVVADVRKLPFEPGSLAEIASAHLIEHFREHQMRAIILPYWRSLLTEDGVLRVICPNWAAMLKRFHDGRMTLADFKLLTFGGQDYEGDDHFAMYTPETLSALLQEAGFSRVEVLEEERMNGICPEMEVLAYR
ncbi:MAG: hypothetical protein DIU80_004085 [Chloroflexota bacterium]